MTTITFGDLSFELRHSAKRRTIGITVERDGQLILASPPEVPMETLEKVVRDKRLWIYSKLLKKESLNPPTAVKEYVSGEGFYYLGRSYRLKLVDGVKRQPPLRLYQSRFELQRTHRHGGEKSLFDGIAIAFVLFYIHRLLLLSTVLELLPVRCRYAS
jgi:predicted metal-dependent hydrolase